jgi:hypothetical protein
MKINRIVIGFAIVFVMAICLSLASGILAQNNRESANGHGTLLYTDPDGKTVRRQFSFSARKDADGTVKGQAIVHNPAFITPTGKYKSQIEISCMYVEGNTAVFGGTVKKQNDPGLEEFDSAFFIVQDNGEPGKNLDQISTVYFDNVVGPEACLETATNTFLLQPIESGNINVRDDAP